MKKKVSISDVVIFAARQSFSVRPAVRAVGFAAILLAHAIPNVFPLLLSQLVSAFSSGASREAVIASAGPVVWWIAASYAIAFVLHRVNNLLTLSSGAEVTVKAYGRLFSALLGKSWRFHSERTVGSVSRSMGRLVDAADEMESWFLYEASPFAIAMVFSVAAIWWHDARLGMISAAWVAALVGVSYAVFTWQRKFADDFFGRESEYTGRLADVLGNAQASWMFSSKAREFAALAPAAGAYRSAMSRYWWGIIAMYGSAHLMVILFVCVLAWFTLSSYAAGTMEGSVVLLVFLYVLPLSERAFDAVGTISRFFKSVSSAVPMLEDLAEADEVSDRPGAGAFVPGPGAVRFENVTFGYVPERPVLKGFSLDIRAGEHVAVVGPSGAGKSTLVRLLLRFFDVQAGKVLIDGQDASAVAQESLRAAVSVVPQDPWMFHLSVRENVAYGRENPTDAQVWAALEMAQAKAFVERLPLGLDSVVGERGVKLSGGERQRLCIARAAMKDAKVVVLDEPTSALDSASERAIQAAMRGLMAGKTSISIAHRLSTVMDADRIVVMDRGAIAEQGTHAQLLEKGGLYAKLWNLQAGGMLGDTAA